jgi:hypothetical protein
MRYRRNVPLDPSQIEDRRGQGPLLGVPGGGSAPARVEEVENVVEE